MANIRPIETYYNGYCFRSRLEARWAVFFDALGVEYEYEPEGYVLPSGKFYLPDFRVKCWGTRGKIRNKPFDLYIEVKGVMTSEDAEKIKEFATTDARIIHLGDYEYYESVSNPVLIVGNIPPANAACDSDEFHAYDNMNGIDIRPFNYELIDGDYFAAYPAAVNGKFYLWGDDSNYIDFGLIPKICHAYNLSRQARFEHGETPII